MVTKQIINSQLLSAIDNDNNNNLLLSTIDMFCRMVVRTSELCKEGSIKCSCIVLYCTSLILNPFRTNLRSESYGQLFVPTYKKIQIASVSSILAPWSSPTKLTTT